MLQSKVLFVSSRRVQSIDCLEFNFQLFIFQLYHDSCRYIVFSYYFIFSIILLCMEKDWCEEISHISFNQIYEKWNKCRVSHTRFMSPCYILFIGRENYKNTFTFSPFSFPFFELEWVIINFTWWYLYIMQYIQFSYFVFYI